MVEFEFLGWVGLCVLDGVGLVCGDDEEGLCHLMAQVRMPARISVLFCRHVTELEAKAGNLITGSLSAPSFRD